MSLDRFASHINAGRSTVTDLEHGREKVIPTWGIQEALDEALSRASNEAKKRFGMLCEGKTNVSVSDSTTVDGNGDDADRERFLKVIGAGVATAPLDALERIAADIGRAAVWTLPLSRHMRRGPTCSRVCTTPSALTCSSTPRPSTPTCYSSC
jgi:hypothetical protein